MNHSRVLVTGAGGMLGRAVVAELADQRDVVGFDLIGESTEVEWHTGDITDYAAVVAAMQEFEAAKKEETQRQVALAEDCGGAATPDEFKRVKDKCQASHAESVKRVSKANETIYAARAHFVLALTRYQQKLKVVKVKLQFGIWKATILEKHGRNLQCGIQNQGVFLEIA